MDGIEYYDAHRFRWYEKPAIMDQKMFHLPVLGWVTVFQFALLVGVGMPGMFAAMSVGGHAAAPWPLLGAFLFARFRPPLLGYEMRAYHILRFRASRSREGRGGPRPRRYVPAPRRPRARAAEPKPERDGPLRIAVHDRPRELRMGLPPGAPPDRRVEVRLDGVVLCTPHPDTDGTVHVVLYPDDMVGERDVTVHDHTGAAVAGRTLVFERAPP